MSPQPVERADRRPVDTWASASAGVLSVTPAVSLNNKSLKSIAI
jgi:hypothetical protein